MSLAIGVDVAARRGCDVVALDDDLVARPVGRVHTAAELTALLAKLRPATVAIDSPPRWATNGRRSCEAELTKRGIMLFSTPTEARGAGHRFFSWMEIGFAMFEAAKDYDPFETFPHAVAVTIRTCLPPAGVTRRTRTKREWRLAALNAVGIDTSELRTIDEIDAALCAYTAWCWSTGKAISVGDEAEGRITLPGRALLDRYTR